MPVAIIVLFGVDKTRDSCCVAIVLFKAVVLLLQARVKAIFLF